jgi:hypothetical protein
MGKSVNDPIYLVASFTDKAIPGEGLKIPSDAFVGKNQSQNDPIYLLLQSTAATTLSPIDAAVVRTWLAGRSEQDAATELNVTPQEVHDARERLLKRIRVTIDMQSS